MSFRDYIQRLEIQQRLMRITALMSKTYEIAGVLKRHLRTITKAPVAVAGMTECFEE